MVSSTLAFVGALFCIAGAAAQTAPQYGQVSSLHHENTMLAHCLSLYVVRWSRLDWGYYLPVWLDMHGLERVLLTVPPWCCAILDHQHSGRRLTNNYKRCC